MYYISLLYYQKQIACSYYLGPIQSQTDIRLTYCNIYGKINELKKTKVR